MENMKENYRDCSWYKSNFSAILENDGKIVEYVYDDPGYEITMDRKLKKEHNMEPCDDAWMQIYDDVQCHECPLSGKFLSAPKLSPVLTKSQTQRKAIPKNAQTTTQLYSSHMLVK